MKISKYEEHILRLLIKSNLFFEKEYSPSNFKSLKGAKLRYDFAIYTDDTYKEIAFIIEVDGEQHFHFIPKFYKNQSDFKYDMEMDVRKNSFCLAHNIPIYRIHYYEIENIKTLEDILNNSKFKVVTKWHNHIIKRQLK